VRKAKDLVRSPTADPAGEYGPGEEHPVQARGLRRRLIVILSVEVPNLVRKAKDLVRSPPADPAGVHRPGKNHSGASSGTLPLNSMDRIPRMEIFILEILSIPVFKYLCRAGFNPAKMEQVH